MYTPDYSHTLLPDDPRFEAYLDEHQPDEQLNALKGFAQVFKVDKKLPETDEWFCLRHSNQCISDEYSIIYRLDAALVVHLASMPDLRNIPTSKLEVLEHLAETWGYENCGYLRQLNKAMFTLNEPKLGLILHAQYELPVGEG